MFQSEKFERIIERFVENRVLNTNSDVVKFVQIVNMIIRKNKPLFTNVLQGMTINKIMQFKTKYSFNYDTRQALFSLASNLEINSDVFDI